MSRVASPSVPKVSLDHFLRYTRSKMAVNIYRKKWLEMVLIRLQWKSERRRALDIGSKDGSFLKLLKDDEWSVVGVDPNASFGNLARVIHGVEIKDCYFESDTFPEASFDLVTCFHVLEHIREPGPFLRSIKRALTPNGLLYLKTPNLAYIQKRQLHLGHVVLYAKTTLVQALEHNGFQVIATWENGPGGMRTFDQLGVLAKATERECDTWKLGTDFEEVQVYLRRALQTEFPHPAASTFGKRVLRFLRTRSKGIYRRAELRIGTSLVSEYRFREVLTNQDPLQEAYLLGKLDRDQFLEITRLSDEFAQLKMLARVLARLPHDEIRRLVNLEMDGTRMNLSP